MAQTAFRTSHIIQAHCKTLLQPDAALGIMFAESLRVGLMPFKSENGAMHFLNVGSKFLSGFSHGLCIRDAAWRGGDCRIRQTFNERFV